MQKWTIGSAVAVVAATMIVGSTVGAFAQVNQDTLVKKGKHGYAARNTQARPLTVAAPPAAPAAGLTTPIAVAGQIAVAPLSGLSQAFGYGAIGGPAKPLPITAKFANTGKVTDSINQGWAQPVPVASNGPIYKLEPVENSGGASPFTLLAAPITAAATLAAAPVGVAGSILGAAPPPPPVF